MEIIFTLLLFGVGSGKSIFTIVGNGKADPNAKAVPGRNDFIFSKSCIVIFAEMDVIIFKSSG